MWSKDENCRVSSLINSPYVCHRRREHGLIKSMFRLNEKHIVPSYGLIPSGTRENISYETEWIYAPAAPTGCKPLDRKGRDKMGCWHIYTIGPVVFLNRRNCTPNLVVSLPWLMLCTSIEGTMFLSQICIFDYSSCRWSKRDRGFLMGETRRLLRLGSRLLQIISSCALPNSPNLS
jgi:hypothetical protein